MEKIAHHIPDAILARYAAGHLPRAFELVVATHISMCDSCRAALGAQEELGGALLEQEAEAELDASLLTALLDRLDEPAPAPPVNKRLDIYPGPLAEALGNTPPRWRPAGGGVRQTILFEDGKGSARLLWIPGGMAVPDHSHGGMEMTMVLQGAFHDETGHFGTGDVEIADETLEHTPIADEGLPCICLAATDARLRFRALLPRLAQPFLRI